MTRKQISQLAKNLNRIIKNKKKNKVISKSSLVLKTGLDYHTISKIQHGNTPDPRINTVIKIARALNISIDDLIK